MTCFDVLATAPLVVRKGQHYNTVNCEYHQRDIIKVRHGPWLLGFAQCALNFYQYKTWFDLLNISSFPSESFSAGIFPAGPDVKIELFISHAGVPYFNPKVKMFNIRAIDTSLPSFMFPAPPICLNFDP